MTWVQDQPRAGHWMLRVRRNCPLVAASIEWAQTTEDPVSGEPMDRSPFMVAHIALDIVPVWDVWAAVEYCESSPDQQRILVEPHLSDRAPRNGRAPALQTAPIPKWHQSRAHRITAEQYEHELRWHHWAKQHAPTHPDFNYRKPMDRNAMPVPKFGVVA